MDLDEGFKPKLDPSELLAKKDTSIKLEFLESKMEFQTMWDFFNDL